MDGKIASMVAFMAKEPQFDQAQLGWLKDPALKRILDAVASGGGEARVVGGAVRDALLGRAIGEIDLATTLDPDRATHCLAQAGLKVVPTGITHGTITVVCDHRGFEMTTLRRDVETDGRRAKVEFTDDWQADAARRDFTINALYADAGGTLYDYFGGREDLAAGRIRFIGDAEARIREDVLRILRFFRFTAWFGRGAPDATGLAACRKLAGLLPQLSYERIARELIKLLTADRPAPIWSLMIENGILKDILPEASRTGRLQALQAVEQKHDCTPAPLTRFAASLPDDGKVADQVAKRLKLSNRDGDVLRLLAILPAQLKGKLDTVPFRRMLYKHGIEAARQAALLLAANDANADITQALAAADSWEQPVFPLQGGDLLKLGMTAGPKVGAALSMIEDWWIAHDFRPGRAECLAEAQKHIG